MWDAYGNLRSVVSESQLESTEHGLVPKGQGWFVLNAREAQWWVDEAAQRHRAGVERETTYADEAYARFPRSELTRYREGWLPE